MSLLEVASINSFYGEAHTLFDVSLNVERHEVVALLGRNGAGKTTTLRTIMGVLAPKSGSIRFGGTPIHGLPPYAIGETKYDIHVVLDDDDRGPGGYALEKRHCAGPLGGAHSSRRLVEQKDLRPGRKRKADLQPPLFAVSKLGRRRIEPRG